MSVIHHLMPVDKKTTRLQVALDLLDLKDALAIAEEAIDGGVDILEAGTPLVKSEGMRAVRELKELVKKKKREGKVLIAADLKTMDAGFLEAKMAFDAGADIVNVLGCARDETIKGACRAAKELSGIPGGTKIIAVDLIGVADPLSRAVECEKLGAGIVLFHTGLDTQVSEGVQFREAETASKRLNIPIAVAGGIKLETVGKAKESGAGIVIVGAAITASGCVRKRVEEFQNALGKNK